MKSLKQSKLTKDIQYRTADPLPVMEHFYTLQGEGVMQECQPTSWLAGCDVGCVWCDVRVVDSSAEQYKSCDEIVALAIDSGTQRVVITGESLRCTTSRGSQIGSMRPIYKST